MAAQTLADRRKVLIIAGVVTLVLGGIVLFFLTRRPAHHPAVVTPRLMAPTQMPQSPEAPETAIRAYIRQQWPTAQDVQVTGSRGGEWHAYFSRAEGGEIVKAHVSFELASDFTITGVREE